MPVRKRKGFTLVELLIVMIIISILAGGMLLAQRGSEASAHAAVIVSDLRLMKASAYLFMLEKPDFDYTSGGPNHAEELGEFMDHGRIVNTPERYSFRVDGDACWVGVRVQGYETSRVNHLLERKAAAHAYSIPLYGSGSIGTAPADASPANVYIATHGAIWTKVK